jgi:excinuclease ABC subunit A
VGTVTEIYDYLRLLYARIGVPHCPVCGKEIRQQSVDQIIEKIMLLGEGERFMILSPVVRAQKGMHEKVFADARKSGFARVRVDGNLYDLTENIELDKNLRHTVDIVVDRLVIKGDVRSRLSDSVESALRVSDGRVNIVTVVRDGEGEELEFSQKYACEEHGISFPELEPRMFSFNNPIGACPECAGIGNMQRISVKKLVPHKHLSLRDGGIAANGFKTMTEDSWTGPLIAAVGEIYGFTLDTPLGDFTEEQMDVLMYGSGTRKYNVTRYFGGEGRLQQTTFDGIVRIIEKRMRMMGGDYYQQFVEEIACPRCKGRRLSDTVLGVTVGGLNIDEITRLSVDKMLEFVKFGSRSGIRGIKTKRLLWAHLNGKIYFLA